MSGECPKCHEHSLDCKCDSTWPKHWMSEEELKQYRICEEMFIDREARFLLNRTLSEMIEKKENDG